MKIGIITMHKVINYGSQLQAYALQTYLGHLGFDTTIIDYDYPNEYHFSEGTNHIPPHLSIVQRIAKFLWLRPFWVKQNRFERFPKHFMKMTNRIERRGDMHKVANDYDIIITGSDQVWNYKYIHEDFTYLLDFAADNVKKISYASSFASSSLPSKARAKYVDLLSGYKSLSVRESNGIDIINQLIGIVPKVHIDPTLLLSKNDWMKIASNNVHDTKKAYLLAYVLNYAYNPFPYAYDVIEYLSVKHNLDILTFLPLEHQFTKKVTSIMDAGPREFITYFSNAAMVVTSSFHGTAFALNFEKPLYAIVRPENKSDDRISDILHRLHADNRMIYIGCSLAELPDNIPSQGTSYYLNKERERSKQYLIENING